MLDINQNFDLKSPVFNFDRDYFNSVEELNAYDTSNVPDHFVTNVGGMLYQLTNGRWLPMIGTETSNDTHHYVNLGCTYAFLEIDTQNDVPSSLQLCGTSGDSTLSPTSLNINSDDPKGYVLIEADYNAAGAAITVSGNNTSSTVVTNSYIVCGDYSSRVDIYGDKGRIEINDGQGRSTNYSASGFSGQNKLNNKSFSLNLPGTDDVNGEPSFSLQSQNNASTKLTTSALTLIEDADGFKTRIGADNTKIQEEDRSLSIFATEMAFTDEAHRNYIYIHSQNDASSNDNYISIGSDEKFKLSRYADNTEGGIISGIKSLTAFANPSATKVWATDGSTVDLTTKANTSDVLLKKNANGGYYIEENSNALGRCAFAANEQCTASGPSSFAEGGYTEASGFCAHAQGTYNIANKNAIHSVGIGNSTTRKNAEYIYAKSNESGYGLTDDPKNGYKYLIGVGGYDGISTDNTTYKSVQEVIADLTARIEQLETIMMHGTLAKLI